jgi:S1-C subfamily serine protease
MRGWLITIFTFAICFALSMVALAQNTSFEPSPHIYKINVGGCRNKPAERTLTGFRVKGQIGIVTALHGVAGCPVINAQQTPGGPGPFNQLIIGKVDIARDVALLWSKELDALPADGLEAVADPQVSDYRDVEVIGYPYDVYRQKPTLEVTIVETTELGDLVPLKSIPALVDRDSPAVDVRMLSVQAHLVPGHSGAPLLNGAGHVIGVGNGGLDLGRVEMGWAIPWHTIEWKTVSPQAAQDVSWIDVRRLHALELSDPQLFSFATPVDSGTLAPTPTMTPTIALTATPTTKLTVTPPRPKVTIKVMGAGAARNIALTSPSNMDQK